MKLQQEQRDTRARELKSSGKLVMGYFCCYTPVEILTAGGVVPYRVTGQPGESFPEADSHLEVSGCPFVRNCAGMMLRGDLDFLDGIVVPHTCDAIQRSYGFWKRYSGALYAQYLEVPHTISPSSTIFFARELGKFRQSLESFLDKTISEKDLLGAISVHNENRTLVRKTYELRKPDPPLVSGAEVMALLLKGLAMPVAEFNELLRVFAAEMQNRKNSLQGELPRLLIQGCVVDSTPLLELIESHNANIVMDDLSIGSKTFWLNVEAGGDPLQTLAAAYLQGVRCPRTVAGKKESRAKDLAQRFGYLLDYVREFKVSAIVANNMAFCDCHSFDLPDLVEYLNDHGTPVLTLDSDYTLQNTGQLSNRIQAFIEMIEPLP